MPLGAHMSIAGGLFNAPGFGRKATCDVIQVFTKSSNQWKAKMLTDEDVQKFFDAQKETGVKVACAHDSYLINLASPDDTLHQKSYDAFKIELERCHLLKIPYLVMHPGSHVGSGEEAGLKKIAQSFNRLFDELPDNKTIVCQETTAGQGTNLGYRFEQLALVMDMVEDKKRMAVCLDTCHIFAAGYLIKDEKDYKKTMKEFNQILGLKKLKVIHINDSKKPFASRVDRHEHIGEGYLGLEPFRHILNDNRLKKIPKILETPKGDDLKEDIENLGKLRSLIREKK
ncbi:MAG: deoxyribonuclease IV [Candidatus Zixiibacteriota bacterium]|nr:MAG: deoxyribonuclease IV [candidate division Zixibacteria bacterium]